MSPPSFIYSHLSGLICGGGQMDVVTPLHISLLATVPVILILFLYSVRCSSRGRRQAANEENSRAVSPIPESIYKMQVLEKLNLTKDRSGGTYTKERADVSVG